ncbi:uncharacterized protein LOC129927461 [Biomphalaria glabrata]|uniref:Uncharacterized protein LOC129927461 n=1 Tax=Biomphalaria glabrata TaxID=6526 RepID=A0A9W3B000_BIOGL|nr:uncharacterized protein LOC129927461 [Biomphalaria glabrata]XP_055892801.1 uncharacterized protein LOC129927461 [Biomphalaria glabrata]XP_055892802.1 uncharacterized protein LOC129927461 [Biomphalaria glabrata]XP_055892803.1 uncharacterized protein LOC129927461 [Biomphalaria glabrata]
MDAPWNIVRISIFLYCLVSTLSLARRSDVNLMTMIKESIPIREHDSGQAVNCGKVPINVTWSPKDLSPSKGVTISLDYIVPYDWSAGWFNVSLYDGEGQLFFGYSDDINCDMIKQYVPCPLRKGMHVNLRHTITDLNALRDYPGDYSGTGQVWTAQRQQMFCVNMTVKVLHNSLYVDN